MTKKRIEVPFTQVSNEVLRDSSLSFKAKGIYAHIYSKPLNWDFASKRIAIEGTDWEKAIQAWLQELETAWYLTREKQPNWRNSYTLALNKEESQNAQTADSPNGRQPKRQTAQTGSISNKELLVIKKESNIYNLYIKFFKKFPTYTEKKKYIKKQQTLLYIEQLLKEFTQEQLEKSINVYFKTLDNPSYISAPQYFFNNSKQSPKPYRPFADLLEEDEEAIKPVTEVDDLNLF